MKRILAMVISVALVATMAITGSIAYLQDSDGRVNTMTLGNVDIEQIEQEWNSTETELVDFTQAKPLYPYVGTFGWENKEQDDGAYRRFTMNNVVDKYVTVKNEGKTDAYVRTIIALEMGSYTKETFNMVGVSINKVNGDEFKFPGAWNWENGFVETIDGKNYYIMTAVHQNPIVAGETTIPSLLQVYMDWSATNETCKEIDGNENGLYDIMVISQGVQADGFENAEAALNTAFGAVTGKDADGTTNIQKWFGELKDETVADLYISNEKELRAFAEKVNNGESFQGKTVSLSDNIKLSGEWTPIGKYITHKDDNGKVVVDVDTRFQGTFNGQGYTISNLKMVEDGSNDTPYGLFGVLNGNVENLVIDGVKIENTVSDGSGAVAGKIFNTGLVKNVTVKNATITSNHYVGGIVGYAYGKVENCTVESSNLKVVPNATATSYSLRSSDTYDCGDKAGGIVGYMGEGSNCYVKNCKVSKTTITGYRDIGGIIGMAQNGNTITGNSVDKSVVVVQSLTNAYQDTVPTTIGSYIGRVGGTVATDGNSGVAGTGKVVDSSETLDTAISGGATAVVLDSGNYIIPDSAQGKTLTIIGNGETVIATQDDGSYEGCDYSLDGSTVTFEGITINTDSSTYTGYARMNGTYNNCTINGTYTLYGDSTFNNCTFNVTGDVYNIWTWGAPTATFNNCTFNSDGKAILLYGTVNTKLTVNGCTFNDKGGLTDLKAAIEIGNDYNKSYELIVNNTTVNGYEINDKGISTGTTLWGNKNSMGTDKLNVVVDGVDVY